MDAACLAFCSKFSPQILLGIHCGSQYPPVCVCVWVVAFCCATKLAYTDKHTHKYRGVHAHPPIHTRVYIYFNLMPWAIYYCADIIQTQWQWQWRGASSVSQFPSASSWLLSPSMPNGERRRENGKWRMSLYVRIYGSCFSGALSRRLSTPHWAGDDCRLQVATSVWGAGVELGHSRTGILFRTRDSGLGGTGIGSTSVCLRRGFDKMIINAFLIIVMASRSARIESHFQLPYFMPSLCNTICVHTYTYTFIV